MQHQPEPVSVDDSPTQVHRIPRSGVSQGPELHRRIQRYGWDLAVEPYQELWLPALEPCAGRTIDLVNLQRGEQVLDVATGLGTAAFLAADIVGPSGRAVATDLAEGMVAAVRNEGERRGVTWLECRRADAEALPFADATFDAVTCVLGLMYPANPMRAMAEMFRVLRPAGRVAACVWGRREACGWNAIFPIVEANIRTEVCPLFFTLGVPGMLAKGLRQAGFEIGHEERETRTILWPTDEYACRAAFAAGPVALAYSRLDSPSKSAMHRQLLDSLAPFRTPHGYQVPGEFVYVSGVRRGGSPR